MTAITWKQGNQSAVVGYVGKVKMFSYMYGFTRGSDTPWELYTHLPGLKKNTQHATPEDAKAAAEQMLKIMLNTLVRAGVQTPQYLDATLDQEQLEDTAQAIARVALKEDAPVDPDGWDAFWGRLPAVERLAYRLKAQAAMKA